VWIQVHVREKERPSLVVSIDGETGAWYRVDREGAIALRVSPSHGRGIRIGIRPAAPIRPVGLRTLELKPASEGWKIGGLDIAAGSAMGLLFLIAFQRLGPSGALTLYLGLCALILPLRTSVFSWVTLGSSSTICRLSIEIFFLGSTLFLMFRENPEKRRRVFRTYALMAAFLLGLWFRIYFLASAGSFDMEYWKAWIYRMAAHGLTSVYGDPDTIPSGHFLAQLRGQEPAWRLEHGGRSYVVDKPPVSMLLWWLSWHMTGIIGDGLDRGETENVAAKLPAVLGDILALGLIAWTLKGQHDRGFSLALVYWVLPVSWISSAVLGYQDAFYAPLAAASMIAASAGRPAFAGALFALAFWTKPLALILAPALGASAWGCRPRARYLGVVILAGAVVTFIVLLPFVFAHTLPNVLVHVYRLLSPGNVSSGCANLWWLAGYAHRVFTGEQVWNDSVSFVAIREMPWSPVIGIVLFAGVIGAVTLWQIRSPERTLASASIGFFAYGMLAVGVYENHLHLLTLLLILSGISFRRHLGIFYVTAAAYVLNLVLLSGLGRFYGLRYWVLEPMVAWVEDLRMGWGFDLTIPLALAYLAVFVVLLLGLRSRGNPVHRQNSSAHEVNDLRSA
jgi:hypothetical protein